MMSWMTCKWWRRPQSWASALTGRSLRSSAGTPTLLTSSCPGPWPDLMVTSPDKANLLGAPLGDVDSISEAILEKTRKLRIMGERLLHLHAYDTFLPLRHSITIPRLLYTLRASPCFLSPELSEYDSLLRSIASSLVNIHFQDNDPAWLQASLPVNQGGLGIRSAGQLAPSAFLASTAASSTLAHLILPHASTPSHIPSRIRLFSTGLNAMSNHPLHQKRLTSRSHGIPQELKRRWSSFLMDNAPDTRSRARLLAVTTKESGAWLNVLCVSSLGLRMDDESIRVAVGLRLGTPTPLCQPHSCNLCGAEVDHLATHGLSCQRSTGRHPRHAALNDIIHRALAAAKIPSRLEPSGLYRSDGKRPDGASLVPWRRGKFLVWDATCKDTFASSYVSYAAREAGLVAKLAEEGKRSKYRHLAASHIFVPVVVETPGVFGMEALEFIKELGHRLQQSTGEAKSGLYLLQRMSVAVQRGNTAAVLGTFWSSLHEV